MKQCGPLSRTDRVILTLVPEGVSVLVWGAAVRLLSELAAKRRSAARAWISAAIN
jgi:hypothetical protein